MSADKAKEQYQQGYLPKPEQQPNEGLSGKHSEMPYPQQNVYLPTEWNPKEQGGVTKYKAVGKLAGKHLLITGGDSGIGRATAILCAMEGVTRIVLSYIPEREESDAKETKRLVEEAASSSSHSGVSVHLLPQDLRGGEEAVQNLAKKAIEALEGRVDLLFNNAAFQEEVEDIAELPYEQLRKTFDVNVISHMALVKEVIESMPRGSSIVNNASINHYVGHPKLLDYSATKGAMVAFTRALSNQIVGKRSIRVNAVAPGPIVAPLPPATMGKESLESFGTSTPMGRPGQPVEIATSVIFLFSTDSSYISGQTIHINGGVVTNS